MTSAIGAEPAAARCILGTRLEVIKTAPVTIALRATSWALRNYPGVRSAPGVGAPALVTLAIDPVRTSRSASA